MVARMKRRGQAFDTLRAGLAKVWDWINYHVNVDPDPHPMYILPTELPQVVVSWLTDEPYTGTTPNQGYNYVGVEPSSPEVNLGPFDVNTADVFLTEWTREVPFAGDVDYYQLTSNVLVDCQVSGGGTARVELYCEGYTVAPDGTETFIQVSSSVIIAEGPRKQEILTFTWNELEIPAGHRLRIKLYGTEVSNNPNVDVYVGGQNLSRLITIFPIASAPAPHAPTHQAAALGPDFGSDPIPVETLTGMDPSYTFLGKKALSLVVNAAETAFEYFNTFQWIADRFSTAAYIALRQFQAGVTTIDGTWQDVTWIQQTPEFTPRGLSSSGNLLTFNYAGVYRVTITMNFAHNESNSGRETNIRIRDITAGANAGVFPIFIARNQPGTSVTLSFLAAISDAAKTNQFKLQIGNGDTLSAVVWNTTDWDVNMVSEWKEPLPI